MKVISINCQKGGVGKSSSSISIASGFARELPDKKILLLDLDSQCNTSQVYNIDLSNSYNTIHDVLIKGLDIKKAIYQVKDNLYIIPGSPNMAHCDIELTDVGKEYKLKECLQGLEGLVDYVFIDNPPALNTISINSLTAANHLIIPCQADIFSLDAVVKINDTLNTIRTYTNKDLNVLGLLLTRYNKRSVLTRQMKDVFKETAENMGTKLYDTEIVESVVMREANAVRQDIFTYSPKSKVAQCYSKIVKDILEDLKAR